MKKITTCLAVIVMALMLSFTFFTACSNQNTANVQNSNPGTSAQTQEPANTPATGQPAPEDILKKGKYSSAADPRSDVAKWVEQWFKDTYKDNIVGDINVTHVTTASYFNLSDKFEIRPIMYSVKFSSQSPVLGAVKQQDGSYTAEVMAVTVYRGGITSLSGYLSPDEFDKYDGVKPSYDVVARDPRYSSDLKPFPSVELPKEFTQIDMNPLSGRRNIVSAMTRILPGDIATVVCQNPTDDPLHFAYGISLYDLKNNKPIGYTDISGYYIRNTTVSGEKLIINAEKDDTWDTQIFTLDKTGTLTKEEDLSNKDYMLYSPDGSKYAFSDNGCLYVADISDNIPRLLANGNNSEGQDRSYCFTYAWADNSRVVYGIGGYEWSNGCGIVDIESGSNTLFKVEDGTHGNQSPRALINGKLYTTAGAMDVSFDPYVVDLSDPKYTCKKIFKDRNFIENIYIENYSFSPDGTKMAFLKAFNEPEEKNILYVCSTEDGALIKKCEFSTGFSHPSYTDFFEDSRIAIYSERSAFSTSYMYIVDIR